MLLRNGFSVRALRSIGLRFTITSTADASTGLPGDGTADASTGLPGNDTAGLFGDSHFSDSLREALADLRVSSELGENISLDEPKSDFRNQLAEGKRLSIFEAGHNASHPSEEQQLPLIVQMRRTIKANEVEMQRNPWLDEIERSQTDWTYPIDNERAKEKDEQASFDEHIFLEREVKDWLPKDGPVHVFMELVISGLRKNPHLTVAAKKNYLDKMKEHFEKFSDDPTLFPLPGMPENT